MALVRSLLQCFKCSEPYFAGAAQCNAVAQQCNPEDLATPHPLQALCLPLCSAYIVGGSGVWPVQWSGPRHSAARMRSSRNRICGVQMSLVLHGAAAVEVSRRYASAVADCRILLFRDHSLLRRLSQGVSNSWICCLTDAVARNGRKSQDTYLSRNVLAVLTTLQMVALSRQSIASVVPCAVVPQQLRKANKDIPST